ncbi:hypothetical protein Tco_1349238, partial [Tanacetum coccineum]
MPGGSLQLLRETLAESSPTLKDADEEGIDLGERNINQCKRKIFDGHYTAAVRVLSSSGVAPYSDATLEDLKTKHPFKLAPLLPHIPFDHHHLIASPTVVLDRIKSFPCGTPCKRDRLHAQHLIDSFSGSAIAVSDELVSSITQVVNLFFAESCPKMLGEYIANAPLTPLVKLGGGIRLIVVGTVWRRLVSKFGVEVSRGSEAILHVVNRLIEVRGDDVGLSMLLVDFKNAFNLLDCITGSTPYGHAKGCSRAWYLDDGTIVGDTLVVGKVLELIMEDGPGSFDVALRSSLELIATASGPGFDDWQSRLTTLPFAFERLGVYSAASGPNFDDALHVFNMSMETDFLSNPSEIAAPKLMKKMADIYFTQVAKNAESTFSLSHRQMALWKSQMEDHTSDWLMTVPIYSSTIQGFFAGDIYGDHAVSCAGIIGIKHRHNIVRDTLVDICYRFGISAGKEVDIRLDGGRDKPLRLADMLLYSWDEGLDVCVDLIGFSPLTQTRMVDFVPSWVVIDVAQRKCGKYMDKCAAIGYGFLLFSFSSLGELEPDAVILLKRIQKFSMTQDIGARATINIFNRTGFSIAKGEDPRSRFAGVFPPNIARPLHGLKLRGGPASVVFDFCSELVMKRVTKTIELMDAVAMINDPQCELLLLCSCTGISRLYFTMRTCPPRVFKSAQHFFDMALRSSLECDVLNYAFLASRLESAGLQTKLFRHTDVVASGPIFDDALCVFNTSMKIDLLSNPSEIAAPKLMKKMADIYFTRVTKMAESTFLLSPRQMALWKSQREDHTSDWLRAVHISGLGQTIN